jgi:outer membrane murein-binding lipoprotein Lpp
MLLLLSPPFTDPFQPVNNIVPFARGDDLQLKLFELEIARRFDQLSSQVSALGANLDAQFEALHVKLDALNSDIDTLNSNVGTLSTSITTLTDDGLLAKVKLLGQLQGVLATVATLEVLHICYKVAMVASSSTSP